MTDVPNGLKHPAKYSKKIMEIIADVADEHAAFLLKDDGYCTRMPMQVLDPFAGTGKIHQLYDEFFCETYGIEIEPEWANMHPRTIVGDALRLPFQTFSMDMVITSPTYGNRLSDHHTPREDSLRRSYAHDLRRMTGDNDRHLHPNNTGSLSFNNKYRAMHVQAWKEVWRVLRSDGKFVLNVSDHVRSKEVVEVATWHQTTCVDMGFDVLADHQIETPRLRHGANHDSRVPFEHVFVMGKP